MEMHDEKFQKNSSGAEKEDTKMKSRAKAYEQ
jgi:hypothetical protein